MLLISGIQLSSAPEKRIMWIFYKIIIKEKDIAQVNKSR